MKPTVIIIMGVSGCGKSTLGSCLANLLNCPFIEGDRYHPSENIAKMKSGQPLTDAARLPWLNALSEIIQSSVASGTAIVVSCSALRRSYRDILRSETSPGSVAFVLLEPSIQELHQRVAYRSTVGGHFMPAALLNSQLDTLEYDEDELFLHFKPEIRGALMPPAEVLAEKVLQKLRSVG